MNNMNLNKIRTHFWFVYVYFGLNFKYSRDLCFLHTEQNTTILYMEL